MRQHASDTLNPEIKNKHICVLPDLLFFITNAKKKNITVMPKQRFRFRTSLCYSMVVLLPSWGKNKCLALYSFVYTSGHCCRWRSRLEVKIMAGSLFVHCKIAYLYSVTAEKCLVISLPNFVTIRRTHLPISCKIFSWISTTKLKIHAMEFCDFIKDSVRLSGLFVPCSLTVTSTWRPRLTAHCPIGERH